MFSLIFFFALALVVSFFCSLMEAVILSVSHSFIESMVAAGGNAGRKMKTLKGNIDRPLAAILTVNTIANTVGAAGVGAAARQWWAVTYGEQKAALFVGVVSGILTLSILVISEIIPKTLGAVYYRRLAGPVAHMVSWLIWALAPIVSASERLAKLLAGSEAHVRISREEMLASAAIGETEGSLGPQETRIIRNLLCLQQIRAKHVLTPRHVVMAFAETQTVGEIVRNEGPLRFSRMPIYGRDLDDIKGFVLRYELLGAYSKGQAGMPLSALRKDIHAVPDTKSVGSILDEFITRKQHIFLVVDEYGGTAGIITLEDAIESLLGVEIVDESDSVADMRKLALQLAERRRHLREQQERP